MKNLKLLIVWIFTLMLWWSYSFWAYLNITPDWWSIEKNCVKEFNVWLEMEQWESALALQILMDSNMTFVWFDNWNIFEYVMPPENNLNIQQISLFNAPWNYVKKWWLVWKLYYKAESNEDPYLNFYFNGSWDTTETSLFIAWSDILDGVKWWKYTLSSEDLCNDTIEIEKNFDYNTTVEDVIGQFHEDQLNLVLQQNKNKIFLYWCIVLCAILIVGCILLYSRKMKK